MARGGLCLFTTVLLFLAVLRASTACLSACVCFNIQICDDESITETRISLVSKGVTHIPAFAFNNHTNITYLAISGNAVTAIDRQAFHGLGSLEVLVLSNNAITSLPFGLFSGLSSLTRLSVVMNQLSELPDAIFSDLTKLERLDLRTNNLQFLSAGVLHGIPYTSVIELKSNPLNCSCSFLHILNYTLGNNALCYYPWQRRQQKLADLNETELCTVYPPTTQPPQVVTIPTRTATMLNTTTQSSGPTTPADRLRTSSISTSDRVTSPSLPSLHSTTTPSQQHHVTTSSDTTHDDVTSSPVTREQNHTHSSVISTSSPVTKKDKTLTENSNPATIDSTVKSTSDVTVKSHSDVAIATVSTVGLVDYYRDTLTNLSTQTISSANAASVVSEIVDLVSNPSWLNSNDVDEVTTLLERALSLSTSPALLDNIVAVTNHLMDLELPVLQDTHRDSKASSRLVILLEDYVEYTLLTNNLHHLSMSHKNLAVEAVRVRPSNFTGMSVVALDEDGNWLRRSTAKTDQSKVADNGVRASVFIPADALDDRSGDDEEVILLFVVYRNSKLFSSAIQKKWEAADKSGLHQVNSLIISCRFGSQKVDNLANPVSLTFTHNQFGVDPLCSWWDFEKKPFDDWSQIGCKIMDSDAVNRTHCLCYHLTNFALLMDVSAQLDSDNEIPEVHETALAILSYAGCALSTFGLCLTIITLLYFRKLRQKMANKLLVNLCFALLLVVGIFAAGISRTDYSPLCRAISALLHYSLLAALLWMGAEAVNLYLTVVKLKTASSVQYLMLCVVVCWGLPAVVVGICLGLSSSDYVGTEYCWIQNGVFFAGFLVPALAILVFNCGVFVIVLRSVRDARPIRSTFFTAALLRLRVSFAAMVILGLTWSLGALAIGHARLIFQYLFVVFNSIQGFLIFCFHCLGKPEVRKAWHGRITGNQRKCKNTETERPVGGMQWRTPSGRMTWRALDETRTDKRNLSRSGSNKNIAIK